MIDVYRDDLAASWRDGCREAGAAGRRERRGGPLYGLALERVGKYTNPCEKPPTASPSPYIATTESLATTPPLSAASRPQSRSAA